MNTFLTLLLVCLFAADICTAMELVTKSPTSVSSGGHSFRPVISADGSRIAFISHAHNLVTNDNRREWLDVFLRDAAASNTMLISVTASGSGGGDGNSASASMSSNGQFIAFASEAGDLVVGDTNRSSDVFVRDVQAGITRLISVDASGNAPLEPATNSIIPLSGNPLLSSDGRWIFFESRATNLTSLPDLTNVQGVNSVDVFARDLHSNVTTHITRSAVSEQGANASSELMSITPNGQRVAFISRATDLEARSTNFMVNVFVRDMASNVTYWASSSLDYANGYRCMSATLSENGRYVAFVVAPTNGVPTLFRRDLENGALMLLGTNVSERATPQITANGRFVVFETGTNIFRWDGNNGLTELVNIATNGLPTTNGIARQATLSADGNTVVFLSDSSELTMNNAGSAFQLYARDIAAGVTHLLTVDAHGQPTGAGNEASTVALARDVARVAFDTAATGLVSDDENRASDVFVRDVSDAVTELVSVRHPSLPRRTGVGHTLLGTGSVSADGRYIAFASYDNDLVTGDTNGASDVFIHDTTTGTTVTPGFSNYSARFPVLSADGRYLTYSQTLFGQPVGQIHRFDRLAGRNEMVANAQPTSPGKRAISTNGNLIAYLNGGTLFLKNMSTGTNLNLGPATSIPVLNDVPVDAVFTPDGRFVLFKSTELYAYDLLNNRRHLVNEGYPANPYASEISCVSGNSRFVVFRFTFSSALVIHDLFSETNSFLYNGMDAAISAEGRFVTFTPSYTSDPWYSQIVVLDRQSGGMELVTRTTTGNPAAAQGLRIPVISADGRFVVFGASASNLVSNDTNNVGDVFVRDRLLGTTTLVSQNVNQGVGNAASSVRVVMAADGRTVVFQSMASDLVSGDYNDKRDIFVLKLAGTDSDADGLDDDWEAAYFNTLARNGLGDFDDDGVSDGLEFRGGTDPTDANSVFRVLTLAAVGGGLKQVLWTGNPSRSYRAEFKDNLGAANWTGLTGSIYWNGTTASTTDTSAGAATNRFYRVIQLP